MFNWLRDLVAFDEQPILEKFNVVDPSAVGEKVRSITLALTPATPESPTSVVSLYWTEADTKVYEKQFEDLQTAHELFDSMKRDLLEVAELTKVEKIPEASGLMGSLLKRYDVHTDSLIDGNPAPITTTMASRKEADEQLPNPLAPDEDELEQPGQVVGSPEWIEQVLKDLEHDYSLAKYIPDQDDILLDIRSIAEDEAMGFDITIDQVQTWLNDFHKWRMKNKRTSMSRVAKIVFQNIFFSTPEEATAYQEQMKKLNPSPTTNVNTSLPKIDEDLGAEAPAGEDEEIGPGSLSYEDFEKNKADEQKMLTKRIEREVQDQVESALEQKVATKFSKNDEELVDAMRGVGRTWEEIADYMTKSLKYKKEDVAMFLDQIKEETNPLLNPNRPTDEKSVLDEELPIEEPKPEAPKPPAELVSPETHDMLVDEVTEIPKKEMMDIAKLDEEIQKKAAEPLETTPQTPIGTDNSDLGGADVTDQMLEDPSEPPAAMEMEDPTDALNEVLHPNDHVYVIGDYDLNTEGFGGVFVSQYKSEGETYAVVEKDNKEVVEVPLRNVKKAHFTKILTKLANRKKEKANAEFTSIKAELSAISDELLQATAELTKQAGPFDAPVPSATPEVAPQQEQPVKFKPMDRAPDKTKDQEVVTPNPELAEMFREMNEVTAKIKEMDSAVKQFIAKIESEKQQRLKEFETKVQPEKLKKQQEELTQRIAVVMKALENKAVEASEYVYRLQQEVKITPHKISDKELLDKVMAKFEGVKAFVESVTNGAKSKDVKTEETILYRSPKPKPRKSMKMLSRRDVVAGTIDTLSGMYEDLVSAFKLLLEVDTLIGSEATASLEDIGVTK